MARWGFLVQDSLCRACPHNGMLLVLMQRSCWYYRGVTRRACTRFWWFGLLRKLRCCRNRSTPIHHHRNQPLPWPA